MATKTVEVRQSPRRASGAETPKTPPAFDHHSDYFWALAWLEHNTNSLVVPGSVVAGATSNLLSPGNTALIKKVSDLYAEYKKGTISKGQYDYQRKIALDTLKRNVGPMERLLFGNKTTRESIRIARGGGVPATAYVDKNFERLNHVAKLAKYGGVVLTGVGVTASCMQIAHVQDQHTKNEILVETISSTLVGGIGGYLVGVFLVSNPIGWGTALVLATGVTAASYTAGKVVRAAYDIRGRRLDFVSGLGVDRICK
jgi:F0F1-type ATP synthase assembly protein I